MIGAGIFLLPASLAAYGTISFIGWILSGIGAILLAIVFSRLSKSSPKTGGPYAYSRQAFGDFGGFLSAWGYILSNIPTHAAIAIAFTGYLGLFFPMIDQSPLHTAITSLIILWILCLINLRGTKTSGTVQLVSTILKILPLVLMSLVGILFIDLQNYTSFNISGETNFHAIAASLTLTLFALMGMECATIPAHDVDQPHKVIPKATIVGTLLVLTLYLVSTFVIMGLIHPRELQASPAPFAEAAGLVFGPLGGVVIGLGALFSTFGALNGWILCAAQVETAIADDGLFPRHFTRRNKNGAPFFALLVNGILVSLLILANSSKGLVDMFTFMVQITAFTVSITYLLSSVSEILILMKEEHKDSGQLLKAVLYGFLAFLYSLWAILGSGQEAAYYGVIMLFAGIPLYLWSKYQSSS